MIFRHCLWQIIEVYSVFAASLLQTLDIKVSFFNDSEKESCAWIVYICIG